jgi:hypothetical protein
MCLGSLAAFSAVVRLSALLTNGVHDTTHGATHAALLEDRNYAAITSRAIDAVVRSVRTGDPLVLPQVPSRLEETGILSGLNTRPDDRHYGQHLCRRDTRDVLEPRAPGMDEPSRGVTSA